jgi:hypothetical protein
LLGGRAAELTEKLWGDADGDALFGVAGGGAADSASAAEFVGGGFGDVRENGIVFRSAGLSRVRVNGPAPTRSERRNRKRAR